MLDWITNIIATLSYWGIAFLMLLENIFPPIPSEIIMPLAGFTVEQGKLDFTLVIVAGTIGSMLGAIPWYYLGKRVGEERLRKLLSRYGGYLGLSGDDIDKSKQWFSRYGGAVVLFGRLIPGIRTYISVPAGFNEMPWPKFVGYSVVGTTCWNLLLTYAGFALGQNYHLIENFLDPISGFVFIGLFLLTVIWIVVRVYKKR